MNELKTPPPQVLFGDSFWPKTNPPLNPKPQAKNKACGEGWQNLRKLIFYGSNAEILSYDAYNGPHTVHKPICDIYADQKAIVSEKSSIRRARRNYRLTTASNHNQYGEPTIWLTLTQRQIPTLKQSICDLTSFIKRLNPALQEITCNENYSLKYTNVIEMQKRNSPHHNLLLFNLPYIHHSARFFHHYWKGEGLYVQPVYEIHGQINYLMKYISKQFGNKTFYKRKRFTASKGLLKPLVVIGNTPEKDTIIEMASRCLKKFTYRTKTFNTPFPGPVTKTEYRFPFKNIFEMPQTSDNVEEVQKYLTAV